MGIDDVIGDFLTALERCTGHAERSRLFRETVSRLGAGRFTYLNLSSRYPRPVYETTYPSNWTEHYDTQGYVRLDPVVVEGRRSLVPFRWAPVLERQPINEQQRQIFDEAADFAIHDGLAIPMHGLGTDFAMFNIAFDGRDYRDIGPGVVHQLHLIAMYYHAAIERASAGDPGVQLTKRETECLLWVSRGKTAWETSQILHIAESTVVTHIEKAKIKLCANTRHYAAVKAIMLGLISP